MPLVTQSNYPGLSQFNGKANRHPDLLPWNNGLVISRVLIVVVCFLTISSLASPSPFSTKKVKLRQTALKH